jgi:ribulose-5-phosphate 4-epimerase/fuculose-1-phosphate aldolase
MDARSASRPATTASRRFAPAEWESRVQLAAFYRLLAKFRMTDLTSTHVSAMVPGTGTHFLLNPYGLLFEEVTASSLVKCDFDGKTLDETPWGLNPAGVAIHGAIHRARPDAACVAHTHTRAGCILAALEGELLPLNQISLIFYGRVAYTDYLFIEEIGECTQLVEDLGDKCALILRNHGLLTTGRTIAEAFVLMYYLDKACEIQVEALSAGGKLRLPPREVCEDAARRYWAWYKSEAFGQLDWNALVRRLDAEDPSYQT